MLVGCLNLFLAEPLFLRQPHESVFLLRLPSRLGFLHRIRTDKCTIRNRPSEDTSDKVLDAEMGLMGEMLGQRFEETLTVPGGEIPHTNCSNRLVLDVRFPNVFVALHCGRLNVKFISGGNAQPPVQTWKVTPLDELTEGLGASHSILSVHRNGGNHAKYQRKTAKTIGLIIRNPPAQSGT